MKPQDRTRAVLRSGLKSGEKLVMVAVCDYCNTHGEAFPSVTTLAADCDMGRSTVLRHLSNLEGRGLVKTARTGRSTLYRFDPESLPTRLDLGPVSNRDPSQIGTPVVSNRDHHPSQIGTTPVPNRDPKRIPKRPSEATTEAAPPVQPWTRNSNAPIRTGGSPDSPAAIWATCCEAAGFQFLPRPRREHILAMNEVRTKASPEVLRGAVAAYCAVVKAGTHPWQKDRVPSAGVFCKELPKWVGLAQGGGTLPRVREMVAGLEGLVKTYTHLTYAVQGEPEEVAEQFKGLLETATGIDRTDVWKKLRDADAWQFGKWAEAARATM